MSLPETASAEWIDHRDALQAWLSTLPADAAIGLDTEFMRRNTFYPQLALLQLGWNGRHALIDPLAFEIGDALQPLLGEGPAVTVMHSASEDLETLAHAYSSTHRSPVPLSAWGLASATVHWSPS